MIKTDITAKLEPGKSPVESFSTYQELRAKIQKIYPTCKVLANSKGWLVINSRDNTSFQLIVSHEGEYLRLWADVKGSI